MGLKALLFTGLFSIVLIRPAFSQVTPAAGFTPPDDTPSIRVGITLYPNYTYQDQPKVTDVNGNQVSLNTFDVTRAYLNFTGQLHHLVGFRITPDITRANSAGANINNNLVYRIKYAYAQFNLDDWTGSWKQTWVRIGANQTPLVDWEEGVYRYRFQGTVFVERVGRLTSSDYGASFHTNIPNNYGEIHTGIYNGEGYTQSEVNNQKAWQTRVTIRPLPSGGAIARGIRVTGFYDWDRYARGNNRTRWVAEALLEHPHLVAGFDYMEAQDQSSNAAAKITGRGYSAWATPIFKEKGHGPELLLRYDHYTPNLAVSNAKNDLGIVGISYWFPHVGNVATALLLDAEIVKSPGTALPTQRRYALHGYLNF
jgi:hypothetical protein